MPKTRVHLSKRATPQTGLRPHQLAKLLDIAPDTYVWIWRDPTINKIVVSANKDKQEYFEKNASYIRTEEDQFDETRLYFVMTLPESMT